MPAQHVDRETFLARLRESCLLTPDEMTKAYELATETDRGRALARLLVERGLLTRFQAEMIIRGRTDGFILGQYRILDQLGRGGMGRVFKAEHQTMNRLVALKVLAANLMKTERAQKLFQREVRAAARLVHPNIVTAYDANQIGDHHYLVMEFVDGPNLHELVKKRGPMPIAQACEFIRQAALGLQYAHEMGMVHRDIKPANLLVQRAAGKQCVIKILDFGLARLQEPSSEVSPLHDSLPAAEQQVVGTPDYLSPEQARNLHSVDIRSDLYSLGCTFYYLLTASVPFPGGTALEKLVRHGSDPAPNPSQLRSDIPAEISDIVARLMAKEPEERFQTPLELATVLAPFSALGSGTYPALSSPREGGEPVVGESPWADIFDGDERNALISTIPADLSVTPVHSSMNVGKTTQSVPKHARRVPGWVPMVILALAVVVGFILGAVTLLLFLK
jgi:eukaryotic-like serine/threonine-protein kinase